MNNPNALPVSDNCCTRLGWIEHLAAIGGYELHVSVSPYADLDSEVLAFCHDEQELITINGWACVWEDVD